MAVLLGIFGEKRVENKPPNPDEPLSIKLPPCTQKENKISDVALLLQKIAQPDSNPVYLLVAVRDYFSVLNRTIISPEKRFNITERCLPFVGTAVRRIYFEFKKTPALPETPARRESLSAAALCLKEISVCLKRLLKSDLGAARPHKNGRRRIINSAIYYFELLMTEQRLLTLRHQEWPGNIWLECNQIYFAVTAVEDVTKLYRTLSWLSVQGAANTDKLQKASIRDLYISIQLFGFMDASTLSSQQTYILDYYNKLWLNSLKIVADEGSELLKGQVVIYQNLDKPPLLARSEGQYVHSLILDLKSLVDKLQFNYDISKDKLYGNAGLCKGDVDVYAVTDREDIDRMLAFEAMLNRFRVRRRNDTRHYKDESPLYVYVGYSACFELLNSNRSSESSGEKMLRDSLAQSSAPVSKTSSSGESARWALVNESNKGMLLQTSETQYISNLFVGQLLAYAGNREGLQAPSIGYISRVRRIKERLLQISIAKISAQIDCVALQNSLLKKNDLGLPGMLVFDAGEELRLLMHQSHRLFQGAEVTIKHGGRKFRCIIETTQFMQREFLLYQLSPTLPDEDEV